ncbi:hypothetical protein FSP39_015172 [Pinctada imbricata]|uniref:Uncharacterized protein n=1 Tax=Pinctada imbricata TaxID=66713 RepID=A0AA88YTL0_PINIB|nr:hypothetical protein FSP39_015172 [Pinctada imbricata]
MSVNRVVVTEFGTIAQFPDPCKSLFQRFFSYFNPFYPMSDNTPVAIIPVQDRLFACSETNILNEFDLENLDTLEQVKLNECMKIDSAAAHPHWEADGTVHGIGYCYKGGNTYTIFKVPPKIDSKGDFSQVQIVASIPAKNSYTPSYYHSFAMTENYYVFVEQPMKINLAKILTAKYRGVPLVTCFDWYENEKTQFHVLSRSTGEPVNPGFTYQTDATCILHHCNAYEEDGNIVMDVCAYDDAGLFEFAFVDTWNDPQKMKVHPWARINRYVLPVDLQLEEHLDDGLVSGNFRAKAKIDDNVVHCTVDDFSREVLLELPQINYPAYSGKKYRYIYGMGSKEGHGEIHTLVKMDMETRRQLIWYEEDCYPSEPVFVQNPDSQDEDGGVILSAVNSINDDVAPFLLVLDASSFNEIGRVKFPDVDRFVNDIHGIFRNEGAKK